MADQDNMFTEDDPQQGTDPSNQQQQQNSGDPAPSSDNPFADKLKGIVNENGEQKYKTVEDALEALQHSQQFIETLKREKQELEGQYTNTQAELEKRASVEDVVKQLTEQPGQPKGREEDQPQGNQGLDEDKVRQMFEQMMQQQSAQQTEQQNLSSVISTLNEQYGEQAKQVINTRAKELNTTPTELEKLARQNPQMALSLLGGGGATSSAPSTSSTVPPRNTNQEPEMPKLERSLLRGATNAEITDAWKKVKDYTYKKYGVES